MPLLIQINEQKFNNIKALGKQLQSLDVGNIALVNLMDVFKSKGNATGPTVATAATVEFRSELTALLGVVNVKITDAYKYCDNLWNKAFPSCYKRIDSSDKTEINVWVTSRTNALNKSTGTEQEVLDIIAKDKDIKGIIDLLYDDKISQSYDTFKTGLIKIANDHSLILGIDWPY
jgi:hypothetical protein